jgi:hypothetical protein
MRSQARERIRTCLLGVMIPQYHRRVQRDREAEPSTATRLNLVFQQRQLQQNRLVFYLALVVRNEMRPKRCFGFEAAQSGSLFRPEESLIEKEGRHLLHSYFPEIRMLWVQ